MRWFYVRPQRDVFRPHSVASGSLGQPIWMDEIFGPVGCIAPFSNYDEALAIANDTRYGLSASVWSGSADTCERFSLDVEVGVCWTNTFGLFDIGVPWGGLSDPVTGASSP